MIVNRDGVDSEDRVRLGVPFLPYVTQLVQSFSAAAAASAIVMPAMDDFNSPLPSRKCPVLIRLIRVVNDPRILCIG